METKKIELLNTDVCAADQLDEMDAPDLNDRGILAPMPYTPAFRGIYWSWYEWQLNPTFVPISDRLKALVAMVATEPFANAATKRGMRGYYEWFVVQCAILSGDVPSMQLACKVARGSNGRSDQYYNSLAGILRGRILADQKEAERQFAYSEKSKADGVHPTPSRTLLNAFVDSDYPTVDREVSKGVQRYWKDSFLGKKAIVKDKPDLMVIDLLKRHSHYRWAYPEAAIAKLSIMNGGVITVDDLWFPLAFVKSVRQSTRKK